MSHKALLLFSILYSSFFIALGQAPDWENPRINQYGCQPQRAAFVAHPPGSAVSYGQASPWEARLDGEWAFKFCWNLDRVPADWLTQPTAGWDKMPVPSNWQVWGAAHGKAYDPPQFTNVQHPFKVDPPRVPHDTNATGLYRTQVRMPGKAADGLRHLLRFDGVQGAATVYWDGKPIAYHEDAFTRWEVLLPKSTAPGTLHELAIRVIEHHDGSYLEDQDYWRLAGIFRSVTLVSEAPVYLADFHFSSELSADYTLATVRLEGQVGMHLPKKLPAGYRLRWSCPAFSQAGGQVLSDQAKTPAFLNATATIEAPRLWSDEAPQLYESLLELLDDKGQTVEQVPYRFGLRRVEIKDGLVLLNGKKLMVYGANRHEFDPETGRTLTEATMRQDLELMRRYSFNAVRTSHYPNDVRWYDLCDEYGVLVMDEANIESHQLWQEGKTPAQDTAWRSAFIERGLAMVARDRNHPSVIFWSLGNESGVGPNFDAMAAAMRATDPTRPIHYESHLPRYRPRPVSQFDINSDMYPPPARLVEIYKGDSLKRPLILCEYAHAMGNSIGNLQEYWDTIARYPRMQGGYIWDWVEQGLYKTDRQGRRFFAYTGDFGDKVYAQDYGHDGLVWADRRPQPELEECRKVFQPLVFRRDPKDINGVHVRNRYLSTPADHLELFYRIEAPGQVLDSGLVSLAGLGPGQEKEYVLSADLERIKRQLGATPAVYMTVEARVRPGTPWLAQHARWAKPGMVLAHWQDVMVISGSIKAAKPWIGNQGAMRITQGADSIQIALGRRSYVFSKKMGTLTALRVAGQNRLAGAVQPSFYRTPTDNDEGGGSYAFAYRWRHAGLNAAVLMHGSMRVLPASTKTQAIALEARQTWLLPGDGAKVKADSVQHTVVYTLMADSSLELAVETLYPKTMPPLPRVGLQILIDASLAQLTYDARGPEENYPDRNTGSPYGRYNTTVAALHVPYVKPQENGHRTGLTRLKFVGVAQGAKPASVYTKPGVAIQSGLPAPKTIPVGLVIEPVVSDTAVASGAALPGFTLHDYTPGQETRFRHDPEIERLPYSVLNYDAATMGVGGDTSWRPDVHAQYQPKPGTYKYALRIKGS